LITREDARNRALAAASSGSTQPVSIRDELTIERQFGWVFFYDSTEFLETGRKGARLFGNAPIIVNNEGKVSLTGTSLSVEEYLEAYEALGPEAFDAGEWRKDHDNVL
jgi:hypothetical protein